MFGDLEKKKKKNLTICISQESDNSAIISATAILTYEYGNFSFLSPRLSLASRLDTLNIFALTFMYPANQNNFHELLPAHAHTGGKNSSQTLPRKLNENRRGKIFQRFSVHHETLNLI